MNIVFIKKPSLLREGIIELLKRRWDHERIYACDGSDIETYMSNCDIAIIDIDLETSKLEIIEAFRDLQKKVIVWVSDRQHERLTKLFELGLDGYFYNGMEEQELLDALYIVKTGKKYIHPALSANLLEEYIRIHDKQPNQPLGVLSKREWEVLQLLSKGYNNVDIAASLYLSDKTVKNYVSSILKKLEVPDRTNAVIKALKQKWIYI